AYTRLIVTYFTSVCSFEHLLSFAAPSPASTFEHVSLGERRCRGYCGRSRRAPHCVLLRHFVPYLAIFFLTDLVIGTQHAQGPRTLRLQELRR
ncbi:MAG: hypothetical protein VX520_01615, partial [Planctomycetota bacterium]|nr:hypothetical protein [Planctomycetota bacterium]